jgi:RNA polymerase sigma-70 factor (ECF subfamily)
MTERRQRHSLPEDLETDNVRPLGFAGDDRALVVALRRRHPGAPAALYDRYAPHLQRVLARVLGSDPELPDLLHEVFFTALRDIAKLEDPDRLKAWLTMIAVFTARGCIRRRKRWRWLRFRSPSDVPDPPGEDVPYEAREALRATYAVLCRLDTEERIAFSLRFIDGMELTEVAAASGVSLATVKRRLQRARARFLELAVDEPALADRLSGSADGAS